MTFKVFDNDTPACYPHRDIDSSWQTGFQNLEDAISYAKKWLGPWKSAIPENWDGSPIDYTGHGDLISVEKCA